MDWWCEMNDDSRARAVYVISVAAELAGVHPQTLRVYERKGLLDPTRTQGGSRRFSERDLDRLRQIQALRAEQQRHEAHAHVGVGSELLDPALGGEVFAAVRTECERLLATRGLREKS